MAISFELQAHSQASAEHVFRTIADLRSWDEFGGVMLAGPDRPVTGGYAKMSTMISAVLPPLAQARPGTMIRFSPATLEEALAARRSAT